MFQVSPPSGVTTVRPACSDRDRHDAVLHVVLPARRVEHGEDPRAVLDHGRGLVGELLGQVRGLTPLQHGLGRRAVLDHVHPQLEGVLERGRVELGPGCRPRSRRTAPAATWTARPRCVEGDAVGLARGQRLGVGLQLRPGGRRRQVLGREHVLVVEQADGVGADREAVLLALVGALADGTRHVARGGEAGRPFSGTSCPVAATCGTFGLSSMTMFGRSPALASCSTLVIRLAKGTTSRLTVTPGWAASNCLL